MSNPLVPAKKNEAIGSGSTWWMDVKDDEFVHFTTASRADSIVSSGKLLLNPPGIRQFGARGVHGISTTYGQYVPRTQTTHIDVAATDPLVAIVFSTAATPKVGFVEEVIWDRDVPLLKARVLPMERGVALVKASPVKLDDNDLVVYTADQKPFLTSYTPAQLKVLTGLLRAHGANDEAALTALTEEADRLGVPPELIADPTRMRATLTQFGVRTASSSRAAEFTEAFFRRHPVLRRFAPSRVVDKDAGGTGSHPEARQSGNEVWLFPKFWALDMKTQDFVFAHEIGHYVLAKQGLPNLIEVLSLAGVDAWDTGNLPFGQGNMDEAFADSFASLVTDKDVERRYPEWAEAVRKMTKLASDVTAGRKPRYQGKKKTEKGNTVYLYSERQIANRNKGKAKRLEKLRSKIGDVRKQVAKDLKSTDPETFLTALAVALIDETYERVGNDESAEERGHFGVTGWQRKHVSFSKGKATIKYTGKAGVKHEKAIDNASIVKALRNAYEGVEGDEGSLFAPKGITVNARKVNEYLGKFDITAKDLRGFHANRSMQENLKAERKAGGKLPTDEKKREKQLKAEFKKALEATAEAVGHEAATLRSQYLVPNMEDEYLKDGSVLSEFTKTGSTAERVLARFVEVLS